MRNPDKEFEVYEKVRALAEKLLPLSPLSELARCYEESEEQEDEQA